MSENVSSLQLSIPNDKIVEIENINFAGVETDNDNNEILNNNIAVKLSRFFFIIIYFIFRKINFLRMFLKILKQKLE